MGELLDKYQAAERFGFAPHTLEHGASITRGKPEGERDQYDWPLPVQTEMRESSLPMGPRRIRTQLWDADEIAAKLAAGRRPPRSPRPRDGAGQFAPRAAQ